MSLSNLSEYSTLQLEEMGEMISKEISARSKFCKPFDLFEYLSNNGIVTNVKETYVCQAYSVIYALSFTYKDEAYKNVCNYLWNI